mmetsp:Transcript_79105/g.226148  ORF Transcript_79105/g.226148 Transcript_79105/m.226148 type:complete len:207 (-) Transcript_79105:633-1253(-)
MSASEKEKRGGEPVEEPAGESTALRRTLLERTAGLGEGRAAGRGGRVSHASRRLFSNSPELFASKNSCALKPGSSSCSATLRAVSGSRNRPSLPPPPSSGQKPMEGVGETRGELRSDNRGGEGLESAPLEPGDASPDAGKGVTGELDRRPDRPADQKLGALEGLVGALWVRVRRGVAKGLRLRGLERSGRLELGEALRAPPSPPSL